MSTASAFATLIPTCSALHMVGVRFSGAVVGVTPDFRPPRLHFRLGFSRADVVGVSAGVDPAGMGGASPDSDGACVRPGRSLG